MHLRAWIRSAPSGGAQRRLARLTYRAQNLGRDPVRQLGRTILLDKVLGGEGHDAVRADQLAHLRAPFLQRQRGVVLTPDHLGRISTLAKVISDWTLQSHAQLEPAQ